MGAHNLPEEVQGPVRAWTVAGLDALEQVCQALGLGDITVSGCREIPEDWVGSYVTISGDDQAYTQGFASSQEGAQALTLAAMGMEPGGPALPRREWIDGLSELVNMLSGRAKLLIPETEHCLELGLPIFFRGAMEGSAIVASSAVAVRIMDVDCIVAVYQLALSPEARRSRRIQQTLMEREARFRAVLDTASDAIITTDAKGGIETLNPAAERMLDAPLSDVVYRNIEEYVPSFLSTCMGRELEVIRSDGPLPVEVSVATFEVEGETRFAGVMRDIRARKEAEAALAKAHQKMTDLSRQAGMAEVATNILHNVGNALNSVNVSASLAIDKTSKSKAHRLQDVVGIIESNAGDLRTFFEGPKGKLIPQYLAGLAQNLQSEKADTLKELEGLQDHIEHIKNIVAQQQGMAKNTVLLVPVAVNAEIDAVLDTYASWKNGAGAVTVERDYSDMPMVVLDRHRLLQVLHNLVKNGFDAMEASSQEPRCLTLASRITDGSLEIDVADTGVGIRPEDMNNIFCHGFTTKKDGHGFGLHDSELQARVMGGALIASSDGPGQGATFTLRLPAPLADSQEG